MNERMKEIKIEKEIESIKKKCGLVRVMGWLGLWVRFVEEVNRVRFVSDKE